MTQQRDIERLLDQWLADGPSEVSDRVVDVVADRIGRQTQLPAWRTHRRVNDMYRIIGAVAGIAAVLVIAFIGFNAFGGQRGPAAAGSSAATSAAPPPTLTVEPTAAPAASAASAPGPSGVTWSVTGDLPAGWTREASAINHTENAYIDVMTGQSAMAANCDLRPEAGVGRTAAEIIGALASRDGLMASGQQVVTVGGLQGQRLDLTIDPAWTGTCPDSGGKPIVPLVGTLDEKNLWLYISALAGEHFRFIVLDVPGGGNVLISVYAMEPEQFADVLPVAMSIVDQLEFTVPQ